MNRSIYISTDKLVTEIVGLNHFSFSSRPVLLVRIMLSFERLFGRHM